MPTRPARGATRRRNTHMKAMSQQIQKQPPQMSDSDNPLTQAWNGPFGVPPFERVTPAHFQPAYALAFAAHEAQVAAIAADAAEPTFANTIEALETAGDELTRVGSVFHVLAGAHTNDAILAIERELAPQNAKHWNRILMDEALFRRIDALHRRRDQLGLTEEQARVLDRYHVMFTRAGAALAAAAKARLAEINERLAALGTSFSQNVLADEQGYTLVLDGEDDLAGLPDFVRAAAQATAEERGLAGKYVVTTSRSSVEPFLQFSARRDLREKMFRAWIARGDGGGATDNKAIIAEMVALRAERARLLGYREVRPLPARRCHGQDAGGGAFAARSRLGAGAPPGARGSRRPASAGAGRREELRAGAVGLALLRREAAQGALRHRRDHDQAVLPARAHHRGGVRYGGSPVRTDLRAAPRHSGLAPGRAGVGGA